MEESINKEEYVDGEDPDGIEGITEEFIVCLARAVKVAQQSEKCCYLVVAQITSSVIAHWWQDLRQTPSLNQREGNSTEEGSPGPSRKGDHT